MVRRILLRIVAAIPITFSASILVFLLLEFGPGEPFQYFIEPDASADAVAAQRAHFGFDEPFAVRLGRWVKSTATLDFGSSIQQRRAVRDIALETVPPTLLLTGVSLVFGFALGIALAVLCVRRPGRFLDSSVTGISMLVAGTPLFWIATWAVAWLCVEWKWFPTGGALSVGSMTEPGLHLRDRLFHLILPAGLLTVVVAAHVARYTRAALVSTLHLEFIQSARARGAGPWRIIVRHALPASLHSTIALLGLWFPLLVGGAVVIETIFHYPGTGMLLVESMQRRDYPVVCAAVVALSFFAVLGNALADALAAAVDPRIEV
jgi:peptide/nickel transport system permease protein